jgi:hypothetical protein
MIFDKLQTAGSIRSHYEESISQPSWSRHYSESNARFAPLRGNAFAQTPTSDWHRPIQVVGGMDPASFQSEA